MLVRCLYASRAAKPLANDDLEEMLDQSRYNNSVTGITGLLCFAEGIFVQVIEGSRDNICRLLSAIFRDGRHHDVQLLVYEEITERCFGGWSMGQVAIENVNPALVLKYSERPTLDPFTASGHTTMALLKELVVTGSIGNRGGM